MSTREVVDRVGSLTAFFAPHSVAVVGASPRETSGGHKIFRNLVRLLDVPVYPIHPTAPEILGRTCFKTIGVAPEGIELAVVFVPSPQIPGIVEECISAGVKAVCVEAGGFADAGEDGMRLQERLASLAESSGTRIWGPNCAGYVSSNPPLSTAFVDAPDSMVAGTTSLVFQSGMAAAALLAEIASRDVMSIDKACSIGNKVDVDEADLLGYLARVGTSNTVALYLESIVDGARFSDAVSALLPDAMVCAVMGNRTPSGLEAAATHTGAIMMQSDSVGSYLRHNGVVETVDFTQLVELSRAYAVTGPREGGSRVAIVTFSGAAGVVAADLLEESGLTLARLSDETIEELRGVFPDWYEPSNPVDVWSTVEQRGFADATGRTMRAVLADQEVDAVVFVPLAFDYQAADDIAQFAEAAGKSDKPVVVWPIGDVGVVSRWAPILERCGVPTCPSLATAVELIRGFNIRSSSLDRRRQLDNAAIARSRTARDWPDTARGVGASLILDEVESKRIMSLFGIPTVEEVVAGDLETTLEAARRISAPVAMKLLARGVGHKTDIDGVLLDVDGDEQVESAYHSLMVAAAAAGIDGSRVLVQPMVSDGVETIVGAKRDPALGWMVMVGMGGVNVETAVDVAMRPVPLTRGDAEGMIGQVRGSALLTSTTRGGGRADVEALTAAILSMSEMARTAPPDVNGIEINPLLVKTAGAGAVAVDGLISFAGEKNGTRDSGRES